LSTQQILGVVGGVVGAFFGYPQLGFVVGSLVGGLLTPGEKTEGPRVDDLKVQVSTYGTGIPTVYGTERVGGNVVWSTDKLEVADTQGGKGGAPENTTYRYFVHMGIVLCRTPTDESLVLVRKIWQDGKLIFDASTGMSVGQSIASAENPNAYAVVYQGHSDQLPDPGEEAWEGGPGSVPAYRGVVRIRMNAVECPGGRVPQFSFEVSAGAEVITERSEFTSLSGYDSAFVQPDGLWGFDRASDIVTVRYTNGSTESVIRRIDLSPVYSGSGELYAIQGAERPQAMMSYSASSGDDNHIRIVDLETGNSRLALSMPKTYLTPAGTPIGWGQRPRGAVDESTGRYAATSGTGAGSPGLTLFGNGPLAEADGSNISWESPICFHNGYLYALAYTGSGGGNIPYLVQYDAGTGDQVDVINGPAMAGLGLSGCALSSDGGVLYVYLAGSTTSFVYSVDGAVWTLLCDEAGFLGTTSPTSSPTSNWYSNNLLSKVGPNATGDWTFVRFQTVIISEVKASYIIADQCNQAGETRYDLTAIPDTDILRGYKIQNPASARSNIDPLLTAFAAYIVDEDGLIKFKKYEDIVSVASISYDELGQAEDGSEAPDAMPLNRKQEIDLPRSVTASYIEPALDYQTASEKAVRQITDATEDQVIEIPLATTSDHAKQIAEMIMFAQWRSQNTRSFKTSRKYAFVSPGDGLTVEYPRGTFRLWRVTSATDTGALCEFNVEPGDAELYTQTAVGATGYVGQEVAPLAPPTRLQLLDIPILRDADNNAGLYASLSGYLDGYPGGELFAGDDDTTLVSRGTVNNESPIGFTESALGDWTLGVIDETNLVTVNVGHHALSSITQDVLLTGTVNVAAIGAPGRWEIVKFQRADDLGSGRYILSGLLRGQRGTEWARATHQTDDIFVVLAVAGMLRPNFDAGAIGQTKSYRAVTKGRSFQSVASQTYVNTGEGLETFSPTNLTKTITSGDIVFNWVRRTRLSENWLAGIVPLGEAAEAFEVVLYTSSAFTTVRRVIATNTNSATYTSAMQSADGYTTGPLYVRVYQISDVVGRGHELEVTI
jgi:hypothetical protein